MLPQLTNPISSGLKFALIISTLAKKNTTKATRWSINLLNFLLTLKPSLAPLQEITHWSKPES
jgi:hypothetical protein